MMTGIILFPILTINYNKKRKKEYEEKRQTKYKEYLQKKRQEIIALGNKQKNILFDNYVSAEDCAEIILNRDARLWERKIDEFDFLTIRLGLGDVKLKADIQKPEEGFRMEDDNLVEILNNIVDTNKTLHDSPISLSLVEKNISALIVPKTDKISRFIQSIIIQLIAFQSYEDLKVIFLLKKDGAEDLEYVKMLPHVWNNSKQMRFFAYEYDEMNEISNYLEEVFKSRMENLGTSGARNVDYKSFKPYYLIISNDYKRIENLKIIKEILESPVNLGFSLLCVSNDLMQLPNECKTFVTIDKDVKKGVIMENEMTTSNVQEIELDTSVRFFFEKICQVVSNIPIRYTEKGKNSLPTNYTFLEMYDKGRIEQLNVLERWEKDDSTISLKAPIGIDPFGQEIFLDIHEKYHGPHGLIAGSTGSGKSEFIMTYILSMAVSYHPDDVTFLLIDYKGGGLAGAFESVKVKLPHVVGTITNIDTVELQRSLTSIQSELRRRQVIFNKARDITDEGTIDIYKYQKLYHEGVVKEAVPHLLIICDEFAELKQQQPDFMDELMSVSRIGRSLGVHLILATQKPSGIVNDQIRSNSKFAVSLKVQDRSDSMDVIKRPDAASLKRAGQFYLQVGNDEYFTLGQSAWAGAAYIPSDSTDKKLDNAVDVISNTGNIIKKVDDTIEKKLTRDGEQLTNIVKYISEVAKENGIKTSRLWLPNIPADIYLQNVEAKYKVETEENYICPVIGEYDDPFNQRQDVISLDLSNGGNAVIYGNAESGKETLLSTIIYDMITRHSPEEVNLYIFDFGTEVLKIYKKAPQVGDVTFITETEKITRFFDMISKEIQKRKQILVDYNGDYNLYKKEYEKNRHSNKNTNDKSSSNGNEESDKQSTNSNVKRELPPMPQIVVIINNYDSFVEMFSDKYDDSLQTLTREGLKCGIVFVLTATMYNVIRYRLLQNFKQLLTLQLNNDNDYYNILDKVGKKRPAHLFGRGLFNKDGETYEFQTAKICKPEEYNETINTTIEKLNKLVDELAYNRKDTAGGVKAFRAKPIPMMPEVATLEMMKEEEIDLSKLPIGIDAESLEIAKYNMIKDIINFVISKDTEVAAQFVANILKEIREIPNTNVQIFDAENILVSLEEDLPKEFEEFINLKLKNKNEKKIGIIIGIEKFLNKLTEKNIKLVDLLKKLDDNKEGSIIVVENVNKLKSHEFEMWYKTYGSKERGIWVGNGVDNQYSLDITSDRRGLQNNCGNSFGYIVNQGIARKFKLLGIKEEENE